MPPRPLTALRNIGPAFARSLVEAGVPDADALHSLGTDAAYAKLLAAGTRPHFIGYYVIEMALQGRPWNDCKGDEKAALRVRFDRIVADARGTGDADRDAFEAMMDAIGVREPR